MTRLLESKYLIFNDGYTHEQIKREGGQNLEVHLHGDNTVFYVKDAGNFITHIQKNLN